MLNYSSCLTLEDVNMTNFKFVISDGKRSWQVEKNQSECPIMGKKIGDAFSGEFLGLHGYELQITGGSDKDGFPMMKDVDGIVRKKIILTKGFAFAAEKEGERKRKLVRGNTIAADIVQVNCKVVKQGDRPIEGILGSRKKEEKAEA